MSANDDEPVTSVHAFLENEANRDGLKNSLKILKLIWDMHKKNQYPTAKSLVKEYFIDTFPVMGSKKEQESFIKGKKPGMSRWLKFLKDETNPLVMTYQPIKNVSGDPLKPTPLGEAVLIYPDIDRIIEGLSPLQPIDYEFRKEFHSNEIRELIEKIIIELESLSYNQFYNDDMNIYSSIMKLNFPSYENDRLYQDLENHLEKYITFSDFKKRMKIYKQYYNKSLKIKRGIYKSIINLLEERLYLKWEKNDVVDSNSYFNVNLVDFFMNGMEYLLDEEHTKYYERDFIDFYDLYEITANNDTTMMKIRINGTHVVTIEQKENIQKRYEVIIERIRTMMKELSRMKCYRLYRDYLIEIQEGNKVLEAIIHDLKRERHIPIYPGICNMITNDNKPL